MSNNNFYSKRDYIIAVLNTINVKIYDLLKIDIPVTYYLEHHTCFCDKLGDMIIDMYNPSDKIVERDVTYYNLHESLGNIVEKSLINHTISYFLKSKIRETVKYYLNKNE